jgi:hypothetical protein
MTDTMGRTDCVDVPCDVTCILATVFGKASSQQHCVRARLAIGARHKVGKGSGGAMGVACGTPRPACRIRRCRICSHVYILGDQKEKC